MTAPLARRIPAAVRPAMLAMIRSIHTVIFASVAAMIGVVVWDGLRGRPGRRTAAALAVVLAESATYASNNQVCPLTPLAEGMGAERGSVVDMFLPDWAARRIPVVSVSLVIVGLVLNARALFRRRRRAAER
ncbi:MAG: hypothetical protein OEW24_05765 [Chloroflexota bacterium]|nr:hypothetical protein [Chloroflexota bacterium]